MSKARCFLPIRMSTYDEARRLLSLAIAPTDQQADQQEDSAPQTANKQAVPAPQPAKKHGKAKRKKPSGAGHRGVAQAVVTPKDARYNLRRRAPIADAGLGEMAGTIGSVTQVGTLRIEGRASSCLGENTNCFRCGGTDYYSAKLTT